MKHLRHMLLAWIATVPAIASSLVVTNLPAVTLGSGEALVFKFLGSGYAANAARFSAPENPTGVSFSFSTLLLDGWDFEAELESGDRSAQASFDDERLAPEMFRGTYYSGAVSNASGSLGLSPELSKLIFAGPVAYLALRNMGPKVALGLPPYTLAQDMRISLSGGNLSVGGLVTSVTLEKAVALDSAQMNGVILGGNVESVPEPGTAALFAAGVVVGLWLKRKRADWRFRVSFRAGSLPSGSRLC